MAAAARDRSSGANGHSRIPTLQRASSLWDDDVNDDHGDRVASRSVSSAIPCHCRQGMDAVVGRSCIPSNGVGRGVNLGAYRATVQHVLNAHDTTLSDAAAVTVTVPEITEPVDGLVIDTVGGVVSDYRTRWTASTLYIRHRCTCS